MTEELDPLRRRDPASPAGPTPPATTRAQRVTGGVRRATPFVAGIAAAFIAILIYDLLETGQEEV